ncbi:hypothetical protein SEMRO_2349_G324370.1 [Seminavis robusta]|uniref:Uncharacterized protein n=1 Tax=Seminavis robusta TaxID=568900 RepID=A0A9N8F025_9STRA|nr:hypothetical protein SEMRO_2349_G324370.1 [Seminavis robusta]|eukprot:Sro2349_g324370.1 n/a (425) ;mRNA; r:5346-6764
MEEIEEYPPSPSYLPLTQIPEPDTGHPCNETGSIKSNDSDDDCIHDEAVLNCYFHVTHAFATKRSYVSKMKNKQFAAPKGTAYRHVSNIASTKTMEQRRVVTDLYLEDWREHRGEAKAADHLENEYCTYPRYNWNYACAGEVGVYPSNCPNESFNRHGIKSIATDCSKNASLAAFLVHIAPRLLEEDSNSRSDPCTIEIPRCASIFAVGVTGFLKEGIDVVKLGEDEYGNASSWLCNLRHKIGVPIDERRIRLVRASLDGDKRPFEKELSSIGLCFPEQVADSMVKMTSTTSANARGDVAKASGRGNIRKLYQGGLPKNTKRRCLSKMIESFDAYLGTMNHQQLTRLFLYLRLFRVDQTGTDPMKGQTTQTLLDTLVSFSDNPTGYRAMLLARPREQTTFGVVKTIATKMHTASVPPEKENNKK